MKRPPSFGQHFRIGRSFRENVTVGLLKTMDHFLARSLPGVFRTGVQQIESLLEEAPAFAKIRRRFRFQDELNFLSEVFNVFQLKRHRHSPVRSHGVDRYWKFRKLPVDQRFLKKQRLPATRRFHLAIGPIANEQVRLDWHRNAIQFASLFERIEELAK